MQGDSKLVEIIKDKLIGLDSETRLFVNGSRPTYDLFNISIDQYVDNDATLNQINTFGVFSPEEFTYLKTHKDEFSSEQIIEHLEYIKTIKNYNLENINSKAVFDASEALTNGFNQKQRSKSSEDSYWGEDIDTNVRYGEENIPEEPIKLSDEEMTRIISEKLIFAFPELADYANGKDILNLQDALLFIEPQLADDSFLNNLPEDKKLSQDELLFYQQHKENFSEFTLVESAEQYVVDSADFNFYRPPLKQTTEDVYDYLISKPDFPHFWLYGSKNKSYDKVEDLSDRYNALASEFDLSKPENKNTLSHRIENWVQANMPTTDTGLSKDTISSFSFQGFIDYIAQQQADNMAEYNEKISAFVSDGEYTYERPERERTVPLQRDEVLTEKEIEEFKRDQLVALAKENYKDNASYETQIDDLYYFVSLNIKNKHKDIAPSQFLEQLEENPGEFKKEINEWMNSPEGEKSLDRYHEDVLSDFSADEAIEQIKNGIKNTINYEKQLKENRILEEKRRYEEERKLEESSKIDIREYLSEMDRLLKRAPDDKGGHYHHIEESIYYLNNIKESFAKDFQKFKKGEFDSDPYLLTKEEFAEMAKPIADATDFYLAGMSKFTAVPDKKMLENIKSASTIGNLIHLGNMGYKFDSKEASMTRLARKLCNAEITRCLDKKQYLAVNALRSPENLQKNIYELMKDKGFQEYFKKGIANPKTFDKMLKTNGVKLLSGYETFKKEFEKNTNLSKNTNANKKKEQFTL